MIVSLKTATMELAAAVLYGGFTAAPWPSPDDAAATEMLIIGYVANITDRVITIIIILQ